ncbi:MAG: hypothetical protein AB1344_06255 [Pseudomonadota bacterium]
MSNRKGPTEPKNPMRPDSTPATRNRARNHDTKPGDPQPRLERVKGPKPDPIVER